MITELNERSRDILRLVVESFVQTGEPVGSRTLSRKFDLGLSPATIRNVLADLEDMGLLHAPHTSAGRMPTEAGLRMFVSGLLEVGNLTEEERQGIHAHCETSGTSFNRVLEQATELMSGLSRCAGLVMVPKTETRLKHIEFVQLSPGRALVILVSENGMVENRVIDVPLGISASALVEAGNFLASRLVGKTLDSTRQNIARKVEENRAQIDALTARVVEAGLATWSSNDDAGVLIVRGQANLLEDVQGIADLERIRALFSALETKETLLRLLDAADRGEGVQIFIGAQNELFSLSGCSAIISPYRNKDQQIVGAIGVVGPMRMNYARIIPMVDYTAKVIEKVMDRV